MLKTERVEGQGSKLKGRKQDPAMWTVDLALKA
jgi:hypothetical protein